MSEQTHLVIAKAISDLGDITLFTADEIGSILYPRTAAEIAAGVTPTASQYPPLMVDRYGINTTPGTTDMTAAIQAAINVAAINGGVVTFLPNGSYATKRLVGATGVILLGGSRSLGYPTQNDGGVKLIALAGAGAEMIGAPGTNVQGFVVQGIQFRGLGAGTALIGIHFVDCDHSAIRFCTFENFASQAILVDSTCLAGLFEDNFCFSCLLAAQAAKTGTIDIDGTDHWIRGGEYGTGAGALTNASAFSGAVVIRGGFNTLESVVAEISDFGIGFYGTTALNRMIGCRADQNWGHGFEITGSTDATECLSLNNGQTANNTYDGFNITAGNGTYNGCWAISQGAVANKHRYGFNDTQSSGNYNYYDAACRSQLHVTQAFNFAAASGGAHDTPTGPWIDFTNADTTPAVDNYGMWRANNAGATTITDFDTSFVGQLIQVYTTNANTTFQNAGGGNLRTTTAANVVSAANRIYTWRKVDTTWIQVS